MYSFDTGTVYAMYVMFHKKRIAGAERRTYAKKETIFDLHCIDSDHDDDCSPGCGCICGFV